MLGIVGAATFLEAFAGVLDGSSILAHCLANHSREAYADYFEKPATRAWVAQVPPGGAPIGFALLTSPDFAPDLITPEDIELKRIYCFSRFHGQGVGAALMQQSMAGARQAGASRLLLGVHRDNIRALTFYRKQGFREVGIRTFQVGSSIYNDLVLAREL